MVKIFDTGSCILIIPTFILHFSVFEAETREELIGKKIVDYYYSTIKLTLSFQKKVNGGSHTAV